MYIKLLEKAVELFFAVNKTFVTGVTGFIGQRLLSRLKGQGARLKVLSRSSHPECETIVCDLESEDIPEGVLDGVDSVFHLASCAHNLDGNSKIEYLYRTVNVDATVRLAEMAIRSKVKRFVFVSSVKAGGYDEEHGPPQGVYGQTKREAELKLLEMGQQSDMHISIVRPSLVYGPGVKGNLRLMQVAIEKGWFPPLPELNNQRSMIHVDNLVQALMLVAEDKRANGEIFIATDGIPYSSRDIYEALCHSIGKSPKRWSVPKFLFDLVAQLSPRKRYQIVKLLGDERYSSEKLQSLGFKAKLSLKDMNETFF